MARPSRYTKALGDKIAERIAEGENIIQIAQDADMPSKRSILRWARKNEHFKPLYREAMELKADLYHHKADEALRGIHDRDTAICARVRIDGYLRLAARIDPRRWNDQLLVRHAGERPGDAIQVDYHKATESARDRVLAKLADMRRRSDQVSLDFAAAGDLNLPESIANERRVRREFNPARAAEAEAAEEAARQQFRATAIEQGSVVANKNDFRSIGAGGAPQRQQPRGTMARPEHVGGPVSGGVIKAFGAGIREA